MDPVLEATSVLIHQRKTSPSRTTRIQDAGNVAWTCRECVKGHTGTLSRVGQGGETSGRFYLGTGLTGYLLWLVL